MEPLNGFVPTGPTSSYEYVNYLPQGFNIWSHHTTSEPTVGARALTLRARTNPSRAEVSIPNFIHELKDLPGMLRDIGTLKSQLASLGRGKRKLLRFAKQSANHNLAYQMGWRPLLSDVQKMLQFQSQVDKRIDELDRLYSSRGLKRRLNLYSEVQSSDAKGFIIESQLGTLVRADWFKVTNLRSWGTIRWMPTAIPKGTDRKDLARQARSLVFGIRPNDYGVDWSQVWNAIPWTWLADWFGNVDDYLVAHHNSIPAAPTGPCNIMTRKETYVTFRRISHQGLLTGGEGTGVLRTLSRAQSSGSLSVTLPFISARQWSILGSLAIQRFRR